MKNNKPEITGDAMYQMLREGKTENFNELRSKNKTCNMQGKDFRALDLRGADVDGIDFTDCYFRHTDLRGLDMRSCQMEGASIHDARISGTYFPRELSPEEIHMSSIKGTRMRYKS